MWSSRIIGRSRLPPRRTSQIARSVFLQLSRGGLLRQGYSTVRAVKIKPPASGFRSFRARNRSLDLREKESCYRMLENADHVYNLGSDSRRCW